MYTVGQVSNMLGVDKVSIYEILIQYADTVGPEINREQGIQYISKKGVEILGSLLNKEPDYSKRIDKEVVYGENGKAIVLLKKTIGILLKEMNRLDKELEKKDAEISELLLFGERGHVE